MNKIVFVFILLLVPAIVFADNGTTEVVVLSDTGHDRNDVVLPVVTYSFISNTLTVEFESEDSFVLEIKDANGVIWYSGPLNTSGIPTVYYVNLQSHNTYLISISSSNDLFYGILEM